MAIPNKNDYIFHEGEKYQVEFYFTGKGEMPAMEYFDSSDEKVRRKLVALVMWMAQEGRIFDKTLYRIVSWKDKIYEFKPYKDRYFNFSDRRIIITNAYRKKTQKVDKKELSKAINIKKDYTRRVKEESYYD